MANVYGMDLNDDGGMDASLTSPTTNFMSSPQASSPTNTQKPKRVTEEQSLIPVTIKMVLNHSNSMLEDGREPHHVKLIAAVREVEITSTTYDYIVEDGSGEILVKEWVSESDPGKKAAMRAEAAVQHQYVRIIGRMQDYGGKPSIVAYSVRKLSSGNELTHHMLEVVYSAEKYKRASQIVGSPNMNMNGVTAMGGAMGGGFNPGNMPSASTPIVNNDDGQSIGLQKEILDFLTGGGNIGRDVNDFIAQNRKYPERTIRDAVSTLAADGVIFSTTDDDHYAYF